MRHCDRYPDNNKNASWPTTRWIVDRYVHMVTLLATNVHCVKVSEEIPNDSKITYCSYLCSIGIRWAHTCYLFRYTCVASASAGLILVICSDTYARLQEATTQARGATDHRERSTFSPMCDLAGVSDKRMSSPNLDTPVAMPERLSMETSSYHAVRYLWSPPLLTA